MTRLLAGLLATSLVAACAHHAPATPAAAAAPATAFGHLAPTRGNTATGHITFADQGGRVRVSGQVTGLKPNAEHGFHVHETGDCGSPDGMSTGGHYNPDGMPHGQHSMPQHHAGDLPSLKADANGVARIDAVVMNLGIGSGRADLLGRGLIVHADPDDYRTQPTGNAGARIACAVIMKG